MAGLSRTGRNWQNAEKIIFEGTGLFDIPKIEGIEKPDKVEWVRFTDALAHKPKKPFCIHFYQDDYKFERLWSSIDRYLPILKSAEYVCTPDFSLYTDFPLAQSIWNDYRKHWIGAYLELNGCKVIPTVNWMYEDSYYWCFDGDPKNKAVTVSALGCLKDKNSKEMWIKGYNYMLKELNPTYIFFYGKIPQEVKQDWNLIRIESFNEQISKLTR